MSHPEFEDEIEHLLALEREAPLRPDLPQIQKRVLAATLATVGATTVVAAASTAQAAAGTAQVGASGSTAVAGAAAASGTTAAGVGAAAVGTAGAAAVGTGVVSGGLGTLLVGMAVGGALMLPAGWLGHELLEDSPRVVYVPVATPVPVVAPPAEPVESDPVPSDVPVLDSKPVVMPAPMRRADPVPVVEPAPVESDPIEPTPPDEQPVVDSERTAELAVIDRAQAALARGRPNDALVAVMEHSRLYRNSSLSEERERLHIEALWMQGKTRASRLRLKGFEERWPNSVHRQRLVELTSEDSP